MSHNANMLYKRKSAQVKSIYSKKQLELLLSDSEGDILKQRVVKNMGNM